MPGLKNLPTRVQLVEVGPRDGLQNEPQTLPTEAKIQFIEDLIQAGHQHIEVTSLVRPDRVPQLADAEEVLKGLSDLSQPRLTVLVPNEKGLERALKSGVRSVAFFTSVSPTFNEKNIGMSVEKSLKVIEALQARALQESLQTRVYISTAFICPYEGEVPPSLTTNMVKQFRGMGFDSISIGDTIGKANPLHIERLMDDLEDRLGSKLEDLALHLHDTSKFALANLTVGLMRGITEFDTSAGGLGGCPYAPGASGNLATETTLDFFESLGIETGIDKEKQELATGRLMRAMGKE